MKTPFDIICKIEKYKNAIPELEARQSLELGRGNMANYWQLKGLISAYQKVVDDFKEFEENHFKKQG